MYWQYRGAALRATEAKCCQVTMFLCLGCYPEQELGKVSDLEVPLVHETTLPKTCMWEEMPGSEYGVGRQVRVVQLHCSKPG